jgi:hypothetical protein
LEVLPNYAASKTSPLNVMARAQYLEKAYEDEFDSSLDQIDLYERGLEKHAFLQKVFKLLKKPVPEYLSEYLFGQIDDSELDQAVLKQTAEKYLKKLITQASNADLSEKLEALLEELE